MSSVGLIAIAILVVPSAAVVRLFTRRQPGVARTVYPKSAYVAFGVVGVFIVVVGTLSQAAFLVIGGVVVIAMAIVSYWTRPRQDSI